MLNLLDLNKFTNDLIRYNPAWPPVPTKLPSDIPKFEWKTSEDRGDHVITFHLWCSSNSLIDDSIRLRLFQCTLIGNVAKWYIEFPRGTFTFFSNMANIFLNHFNCLSTMKLELSFWPIFIKTWKLTFLTIFRNGDREIDLSRWKFH